MKTFNDNDLFSNMSANIFGQEIKKVFTKIGDAADEASDTDSNTGHIIGSFLDALTDNIEIKIGKKDQ